MPDSDQGAWRHAAATGAAGGRVRRVAWVTGGGTAAVHVEVARRLLAAETRFRRALSLMLTRERPALETLPGDGGAESAPAGDGRGDSFDACRRAFEAERAETLRLLDACSADQLNRKGIDPLRGPMTVADLVAAMLAHDTDRLGDLVVR